MSTELTTIEGESREISRTQDVDAVLARMVKIHDLMRRAMTLNVDYGTIPGTNSKPTLLKPGAEKLAVMFQFAPRYRTVKNYSADGHLTVECTCEILNRDGVFLGEANTICSTRESKYRYRGGSRKCPQCGKEAIKKSKYPPRDQPGGQPGFYCFGKIGGCGQNFAHDDPAIVSQSEQKQENPDLADSYNTVLRIAEKRAFLGAIRLVTGSSALFDEEMPTEEVDPAETPTPPASPATHTNGSVPASKPDVADAGVVAEWKNTLANGCPNIAQTNAYLPGIKAIAHKKTGVAVWNLVKDYATKNGWEFVLADKCFKEKVKDVSAEQIVQYREWLKGKPSILQVNAAVPDIMKLDHQTQGTIWAHFVEYAVKQGWNLNVENNGFILPENMDADIPPVDDTGVPF